MSLDALNISYTLRPERIVCVVDGGSIGNAVIACSRIWGGILNPMVLVGEHIAPSNVQTMISATVERFDADAVVSFTTAVSPSREQYRSSTQERVIRPETHLNQLMPIAPFGRALEGTGPPLLLPALPDGDLFGLARFGAAEGSQPVVQTYSDMAERFDDDQRRYPLQITRHRLGEGSLLHRPDDYVLFLVDRASESEQVVEFWNIRATGRYAFPVDLHNYETYSESVRQLVHRTTHRYGDGHPYRRVVIVPGNKVGGKATTEFARWVESECGLAIDVTTVQRVEDVRRLSTGRLSTMVLFREGQGLLVGDPLPVEVGEDDTNKSYVADLQLREIGEYVFWVPSAGPHVEALLSNQNRLGPNSLVVRQRLSSRDVYLKGLPRRRVMMEVLRDHGIEVLSTSTAGLALDRIIAHLGGNLANADILCHTGVRDLLQRLEGGIATVTGGEALKLLSRSLGNPASQQVFDELFSKGVLRAGIMFQCTQCERRAWYAVGTFDRSFRCQACFAENTCPRLDRTLWHYRADGLFMLQGRMGGCLAVLSVLLFLESYLVRPGYGSPRLHWLPSFEYTGHEGGPREIDLAIMSPFWLPATVVGEVKSGGRFEEEQIRSLCEIARNRNIHILFATLAADFSDEEKHAFRDLRHGGFKLILLKADHLNMSASGVGWFHRLTGPSREGVERLSHQTSQQVLDGLNLPMGASRGGH